MMEYSYSYSEGYIKNARGMRLFTCRWLPANPEQRIKALVFICHGILPPSSSLLCSVNE